MDYLNESQYQDQMCTLKRLEMPKYARNMFNTYLVGSPV